MPSARRLNVCFHGIGKPGRELEPGEERYWVSAESYHRILDELTNWPNVHISFDDGNYSDIQVGLPGLLERQLTASFFVLAGRLDTPGSLRSADVRELSDRGMSIGTHGMDHRPWRKLAPDLRRRELVEARERISDIVGIPVREAALPLGQYDRALLAHLRALRYSTVHTSDRRVGLAGSWLQPRFSVRTEDSPQALRADVLTPQPWWRRARASARGLAKRVR